MSIMPLPQLFCSLQSYHGNNYHYQVVIIGEYRFSYDASQVPDSRPVYCAPSYCLQTVRESTSLTICDTVDSQMTKLDTNISQSLDL